MSSNNVFNVKDKVFAKIRGYPAWPAIVSSVKFDLPSQPSRQRYVVYFYGTGERGHCKPEELFPYEEYKSKLGKPSKRKYFAEALLQIETDDGNSILPDDDPQAFVTPSNTSDMDRGSPEDESVNFDEVEKSNETYFENEGKLTTDGSTLSKGKKIVASRTSLGLSISKGKKRKISDVQSEAPLKKSRSNKPKIVGSLKLKEKNQALALEEQLERKMFERGISKQQKLKQTVGKNITADRKVSKTTNKQSKTHNTTESVLETSPTSSGDISSNSANVEHVSRIRRTIKSKKYSDRENESEVSKCSRPIKENSKKSEKLNSNSNNETDSSEQNNKTKDTNSETRKTSKIRASASLKNVIVSMDTVVNGMKKKISQDHELPMALKDLLVTTLSGIETDLEKAHPKRKTKIGLLHTEIDLLEYIHKLRLSLRADHADYEKALEILEHIMKLKISALMLTKHQEVVKTIKQLTVYTGNGEEWNLNEEEIVFHNDKSALIRQKADVLYNQFMALFTIPKGQSFEDTFNKEVRDFLEKTKHLASRQMYGLTSKNELR